MKPLSIFGKFKQFIKRKLAEFIYPEINELIAIDIREAFKDHG